MPRLSLAGPGAAQLETENAGASVAGPLHGDLAALYRARVVGLDGSTDPAYAELMVAETVALCPVSWPTTRVGRNWSAGKPMGCACWWQTPGGAAM